jgi:hypothetical protein
LAGLLHFGAARASRPLGLLSRVAPVNGND